jgi:tRNA A37 N6-isopentenylltransferase MiaA
MSSTLLVRGLKQNSADLICMKIGRLGRSDWMKHTFFIVGPTASGKSELAAEVAREMGAEIVSADAFQIYRGLDVLTAKPDASTLAKIPHHLIGTTPLHEEMNAEKYRRAASNAIDEIHSRGKLAIVVGGSGLYIKALTDGLAPIPAIGVFVFRDREELYARINQRVEALFENEVIEQARAAGDVSVTASQMIGFREIHELLEGKMSISQCVAAIQHATRRYAKRQLTWFRRQTNFLPLNLSLLTHHEAMILLRMLSERQKVSGVGAKE